MISVDTLRRCSWLDRFTLESLLRKNYPSDRVATSDFVGITNGGEFCYKIGYQDPELNGQGLTFCKVFVHIDNDGNIVANY